MLLAEVILDIPTRSLDGSYTYSLDNGPYDYEPDVGCAVLVEFGRRKAVGFIARIFDDDAFEGLKPIEAVLSRSYFDENGARCAKFLARRYVAPLSSCIRCFVPTGAVPKLSRNAHGGWAIVKPSISQVDDRWVTAGPEIDNFSPRGNAHKQIAVIEAVRNGDIKASELNLLYGKVDATVSTLAKKGVVSVESRRRMRLGEDSGEIYDKSGSYRLVSMPNELTSGQESALGAIEAARTRSDGQVVLIDGVTGSGKTEVYLRAIRSVLDDGQSAIVLVPEISLTPQTVARFRGRFGNRVAVLHSKMSPGERYDQWDLIRTGEAKVVIGARSALFSPLQNLGLVVIDEEHESTYKQESDPRYVTRDVAAWMMGEIGGTLVLGSATPSIESLHRVNVLDNWHLVRMADRANGRPMPKIEVVDMSFEFRGGSREMFSGKLRSAMLEELSAGHKVVLLLNQRGYAKFLLCRDCGFVPKCTSCSTSLTYHSASNRLVCHHCGHSRRSPAKCPECGSPYLRKFGAGTQRLEDELRGFLDAELGEMPEFPSEEARKVPIIRMDADTTSKRGSHRRLLEQFAEAPTAVLLGTQMIAKGLDFDDVTLVGVVNADAQLHLPDFRSSERTFDLIEQVAGRAGRGNLPGKVMVQTYESEDIAIKAAALYDREMFLKSEMPKRRILKYPPYTRMANVLFWGKKEESVSSQARAMHALLEKSIARNRLSSWEALAPTPCVFERLKGSFRWHIVVKCPMGRDISTFLRDVYRQLKPCDGVNMSIDVDPYDLL